MNNPAYRHVSLSCRDLKAAKIFYAQVMGDKLVHEIAGSVEYWIKDIIIGLSQQSEDRTGVDDEYQHYAFYIDGANFELMTSHDVPYRLRGEDSSSNSKDLF